MPIPATSQLAKPKDDQEFADIVWELYSKEWNDPNAQPNGRNGQPQAGVDIFGRRDGAGPYLGIQCKLCIDGKLTEAQLRAEVTKAESFNPTLSQFIIATSYHRDVKLQQIVRDMNAERETVGVFSVQIVFWEDLCALLTNPSNGEVLQKYWSAYFLPSESPTSTESAAVVTLEMRIRQYRRTMCRLYRRQLLPLVRPFDAEPVSESAELPQLFVAQDVIRFERDFERYSTGNVEAHRLPVMDLVADENQPWVLLLGDPGSGKSSLLRWIVLLLCQDATPNHELLNDMVPVLIDMPLLEKFWLKSQSCSFYDYLNAHHSERSFGLDATSLRCLASEKRLLWMFDGLDEISNPHIRQNFLEMIGGLVETEPGRGILTSRIDSAATSLRILNEFNIEPYKLLDFSDEKIFRFVDQWMQTRTRDMSFRGGISHAALSKALKDHSDFRHLCRNPLLLTLAVVAWCRGTKPRTRHELYQEAIELLAHTWEKGKRGSSDGALTLNRKKVLLRRLAWHLQGERSGSVQLAADKSTLLSLVREEFREEFRHSPERVDEVVNDLIETLSIGRLVLARSSSDQQYSFMHRTFQEYLAAEYMNYEVTRQQWTHQDVIGIFCERWSDESWQPTLFAFAAFLDRPGPGRRSGNDLMQVLRETLLSVPLTGEDTIKFATFSVHCIMELSPTAHEKARPFLSCLFVMVQHAIESEAWGPLDQLISALRVMASRKPDMALWDRWALDTQQPAHIRMCMSVCALATCRSCDRVAILLRQLAKENQGSIPRYADDIEIKTLFDAALTHGDWKQHELLAIDEWLTTVTGVVQIEVAAILAQIVRKQRAWDGRTPQISHSTPQARRILLEKLRGSDAPLRWSAIRAIGPLAAADPSLRLELAKLIHSDQNFLVRLNASWALFDSGQRKEGLEGLRQQIPKARGETLAGRLIKILQEMAQHDNDALLLLQEVEQQAPRGHLQEDATHALTELGHEPLWRQGAFEVDRSPQRHCRVAEERVYPERERLEAALRLPREPAGTLYGDVRRATLAELAESGQDGSIRLKAILHGAFPVTQRRELLRHLINTTSDESIMLKALEQLGAEAREEIGRLQQHARSSEIRKRASQALILHQLRSTQGESIPQIV